jgi:predicted MFS family arabinose efflux permease
MVTAPLFDLWMDKRETREVLCVSMCLLVVGSVVYVLVPSSYSMFGILMSRLMVGVAAGGMGERERERERDEEMAAC